MVIHQYFYFQTWKLVFHRQQKAFLTLCLLVGVFFSFHQFGDKPTDFAENIPVDTSFHHLIKTGKYTTRYGGLRLSLDNNTDTAYHQESGNTKTESSFSGAHEDIIRKDKMGGSEQIGSVVDIAPHRPTGSDTVELASSGVRRDITGKEKLFISGKNSLVVDIAHQHQTWNDKGESPPSGVHKGTALEEKMGISRKIGLVVDDQFPQNGTGSSRFYSGISMNNKSASDIPTGSMDTVLSLPGVHIGSDKTSNNYTQNITADGKLQLLVNCTLLGNSNKDEWQKAEALLKEKPYKAVTEEDYVRLTTDCDTFRRNRGYYTKTLSQTEINFPLAFGIRIHEKIEQFERLLRLIYMPHNVYCVYTDKKSPNMFHRAVKAIVNCLPNVFIASKLDVFVYASFSPVKADMQCMQDLIKSPVQWKYFLNTAGTELPLKTNLELVTLLSLLNGTNDIEQYPFRPNQQFRYKQKHYIRGSSVLMTNQPKPGFYRNITLYKGSAYNSFSRSFVKWVLSDEVAQSFIEWTKDTYSPDETVWGSLNLWPEAPGGYDFMVTQTAKTFLSQEVIWVYSAAHCYGEYVRGICMFSFKELPWLKYRWEFFANKFDLTKDYIGYQCVEEWHRERTTKPDLEHSINWQVVNRLPQVKRGTQYNKQS